MQIFKGWILQKNWAACCFGEGLPKQRVIAGEALTARKDWQDNQMYKFVLPQYSLAENKSARVSGRAKV